MRQLLLAIGVLSACTVRNPEVCCENAAECAQINTNEIVICEVGVCVGHVCVDPGPCDGDEDCAAPETCRAGVCESPPPPVDAPLTPAFDIAYPNEWRFSVSGPAPTSLMIINTGLNPLSMATLQLRSIDDDHPTAFVRVVATASQAEILPGFAGGLVSQVARPFLIDNGLVQETRTDVSSDYLSMELLDAPEGTYDINVQVVFGLDGVDAPMNMTIHVVPGPTIFVDPEAATRVSLFR